VLRETSSKRFVYRRLAPARLPRTMSGMTAVAVRKPAGGAASIIFPELSVLLELVTPLGLLCYWYCPAVLLRALALLEAEETVLNV
jgi:hypothetical protein